MRCYPFEIKFMHMIFYNFGRLDDEIETLNSITIDATTLQLFLPLPYMYKPSAVVVCIRMLSWKFDVLNAIS